ncbi:TIGR00255 family protein [Treponema vincentii F0403]|uniref:TIGR00255 family protein n=1 Tax=Treponema vincentii F0403 TaxID=1125702 RepID=S3MBX8_9SPIR|nr:YicC/YloC family endoribonuclease [Treponema vincentii]EPF46529.1 TIGR00255 family protein [Treponema vincentii F0403]
MKSMTSYAYLDGTVNGTDISCELKSYNSRYLDLNINIPSTMTQLEPFLRKYFSKQIIRGKVDFYLRLKKVHSEQPILPNIPLAQAYYKSIADIARALGMESQITLDLILRQEGVLQIDKDFDEELWQKALVPILDELIGKFNSCRIEEGKALYADIRKMLSVLSDSVTEIERHAAKMEELFSAMLKKKFSELMEHEPDHQRVMQEVAVLLVKYTINEEIIRAKAHIAALEKEITLNETPGRRIDSLCQEINREINTIGSKNQLTEIGQAVISAKDALENIREQAHNIE